MSSQARESVRPGRHSERVKAKGVKLRERSATSTCGAEMLWPRPGRGEDCLNVFRTDCLVQYGCVTLLNRRRLPNKSKLNAMVTGEQLPVVVLPQSGWERDAAGEGDTLPLATRVKAPTVDADLAKSWQIDFCIVQDEHHVTSPPLCTLGPNHRLPANRPHGNRHCQLVRL